MSKPRFLILTASTGNGHISAANALKEVFHQRGCDAEVVNVMDHVVKAFRKWFQGGYEMLVRKGPDMWGHLYRTSDRPLFNYQVQTFLDWSCSNPLDQVIRDYKPDWVVNTHSVAQPRLPKLQKELGFGSSVVITDLYPHRMWLRGRPNHYFVPNAYTQEILEKRIPWIKGHIDITGIPINPVFSNPPTLEAARAQLGYSVEDKLVVVTSGGIGAGPFLEVVNHLSRLDAKLMVVCGRSAEAHQLMTTHYGSDPDVKVVGHATQADMATMMAATDVLVGKSGGLTTFEALAVGCPFVVYRPFLIPGQEEGNADWIQDHGAGVIAKDLTELDHQVKRLLEDDAARSAMRMAAKLLAKPDATAQIVDRMIELAGLGLKVTKS